MSLKPTMSDRVERLRSGFLALFEVNNAHLPFVIAYQERVLTRKKTLQEGVNAFIEEENKLKE